MTDRPRLTRRVADSNCANVDDALVCTMATIEDGLLEAGARPTTDYTMNDLATWAMQIVVKNHATSSRIAQGITVGWNAEQVAKDWRKVK